MTTSSGPPPHELRSRWLHAMTSTFTTPIIWRAAYDRQLVLITHIYYLDLFISKITRIATDEDHWTFPILLAWLNKLRTLFVFANDQHQIVIDSIKALPTPINQTRKEYRQTVIKRLAVLHQYTHFLYETYWEMRVDLTIVFERTDEYQQLRTQPITRMKRRWSASDIGHHNLRTLRNRYELEDDILGIIKDRDQVLVRDILHLREIYNSGRLFRKYYRWVGASNEKRKKICENQKKMYRYPRSMWTVNLKNEDAEWKIEDGVVPHYEQDGKLHRVFHRLEFDRWW